MLKKLLPILLALIGIGAGVGAGVALKAPPEEVVEIHPCGPDDHAKDGEHKEAAEAEAEDGTAEFDNVKLNNQFIVPVINGGLVTSLVVLSLSIEVKAGQTEDVYKKEPRLRDAFLQVLFDHANNGGFDGQFTNGNSMILLRSALKEVASKTLGSSLSEVLIHEIVRQDI